MVVALASMHELGGRQGRGLVFNLPSERVKLQRTATSQSEVRSSLGWALSPSLVTPKERISVLLGGYESSGFEQQKVRNARSVWVVRLEGDWGQKPKSLWPQRCLTSGQNPHALLEAHYPAIALDLTLIAVDATSPIHSDSFPNLTARTVRTI